MSQDLKLFLSQLVRKPTEVVALAPSSTALAEKMADALPDGDGPIAELGPGTGKITDALLRAGVTERDMTLFEMNPDFVTCLRERYPSADVRNASAEDVGTLPTGLRAVVSGLPLLSMPLPVQRAIVGGTFDVLRPGGVFIQFTYGITPPVKESLRQDLGLTWQKSDRVWGNLPPACVYAFSRPLN